MALVVRLSLLQLCMLVVCYTLQCSMGNESTDCLYWYYTVPRNNSASECNPLNFDVQLQCEVLVPPDNYTSVTVNWYRSTDVGQVQIRNDRLLYLIDEEIANQTRELNISGVQTFFLNVYYLSVQNFTSSDNGLYWCEVQVNDTALLPSPTAYVTVNGASDNACFVDQFYTTLDVSEIICAENCTSNSLELPLTMTSTNSVIMMTPAPSPNTVTSPTLPTTSDMPTIPAWVVIVAPAAGGFVLLVVCCLLLACCCCCVCRRRRRRRKKQKFEAHKTANETDVAIEFKNELYEDTSPSIPGPAANHTTAGGQAYSIQPMTKSVESHTYETVKENEKSKESHTYDIVDDAKIATESTAALKSKSNSERKGTGPQVTESSAEKNSDKAIKERVIRHEYDEIINPSLRPNQATLDDHSYQEIAKDAEAKSTKAPDPFDVYSSPSRAAGIAAAANTDDHYYHTLDSESAGGKSKDAQDDSVKYDALLPIVPIEPEIGTKAETSTLKTEEKATIVALFDDPSYAVGQNQPETQPSTSAVPAAPSKPPAEVEGPPVPPHANKGDAGRASPKYENSEIIAENKKAGNCQETNKDLFDDLAYEGALK